MINTVAVQSNKHYQYLLILHIQYLLHWGFYAQEKQFARKDWPEQFLGELHKYLRIPHQNSLGGVQ